MTDFPLPVGIASAVNRCLPSMTLSIARIWSGYQRVNFGGNPRSIGSGSVGTLLIVDQILEHRLEPIDVLHFPAPFAFRFIRHRLNLTPLFVDVFPRHL